MQYFGQVGSGSSKNPNPKPKPKPNSNSNINSGSASGPLAIPTLEVRSEPEKPPPSCGRENMRGDAAHLSVGPDSINETAGECNNESSPPLSQEGPGELRQASEQAEKNTFHAYPTPPVSHPPSLHKLNLSDSGSEEDAGRARRATTSSSAHRKSISESIPSHTRRASLLPLSSIVTTSNVLASHFSNPSEHYPATTPSTPVHSRLETHFHESPSYDRLKKLTDDVPCTKSIPPTPTRALSNQTAKSDASGGSENVALTATSNGQNGKANAGEATPAIPSTGLSGAPVAAPKGKLTVKITEARGLRKSREPYVVAVFQRNELVSKGPLPEDRDENEDVTSSPMMGGIPIMRSGSDSGRPMAIPMKSRQSSNTSLSDYRDFKAKGRRSFTNPKWDTEAVL
jgi:protein-serine/threonine kinase